MNNEIILWVLVGFAAGFLLEYLIDLFWHRRKLRRVETRHLQSESMLREQVEEVEHLRFQITKFDGAFDEYEKYNKQLEYELETAKLEMSELRVQSEASDARARQFQSDSVVLRRQLKQLRAEANSGSPDADRQIARYKRALYDSVSENKRLASQLRDVKAQLHGQDDAMLTLNGAEEIYKPVELSGDPLEKISGIGNVYADRLRAAGIRTFDDLSRMRAERLTDIIQPKKWQQIEPDRWIAEAADFASVNGSNGDHR